MSCLARIVVVNIPHHVTQRGNAKQYILSADGERMVYLELLQQYVKV
jgi:putative transposase